MRTKVWTAAVVLGGLLAVPLATLPALPGAEAAGAAPIAVPTASGDPASGGALPVVHHFSHLTLDRAFTVPPTTSQCQQTFGFSCYTPNQIEKAYQMGSLYAHGSNGAGETIAVVDPFGSPTITHDLGVFDTTFGLPAPPSLKIIQPAGAVPPFNGKNSGMVGWAYETTLDVEYAHAMAPGAAILVVETPINETLGVTGFPQIVQAENFVINHGLANVISQSFGAAEASFPSAASITGLRSAYLNARAHGVTVLASAGDQGSTGYSNTAETTYYTKPTVNWPASDPLVTAVGGTLLLLNDSGSRISPDVVWNDTDTEGDPWATGGGLSQVFSRPTWQNSVIQRVGNHRGIPDVSLSAAISGAVWIYASFPGLTASGFYPIAGTSEASPLFSGVVAIADQKAGRPLGSINPALYALGSGSKGLPDITTGNNTVSFIQNNLDVTVPGYSARTGYDLASGLGTVNGANLVAALATKPG